MKNLWMSVTQVNKNENCIINEIEPYETMYSRKEDLYEACKLWFGKPVGEVYVEINGKEKSVGWVFEKSEKYEDTQKPYICENWITTYKKQPIKKVIWEVEYA